MTSVGRCWIIVAVYSAGMALVEAATVLYLRTMVNRQDPYQPHPVPVPDAVIEVELVRELATLLMLGAVGGLAGRTPRSRFGYFLVAFGLWDILYYVFLAVIGTWPRSVFDWDILFLIPLPWWGPVLAPVSLAVLMVVGGTLLCLTEQADPPISPPRWAWPVTLGGIAVALYVFMADAISVADEGLGAVRLVRPVWFNWPLFIVAFLAMAAPAIALSVQLVGRRW